MNTRNLGGLIVLNVVLLVTLGVLSFTPERVEAQHRPPGDYIMVAGTVPGQTGSAIYITDINNQAMLVVTYDIATKSLRPIAGRNIVDDLNTKGAGR